ncbi:MAG: protein kinase [Kineosporiaceae bacterium]
MTAPIAPQSGQCLGDRYRLVERIAVGGMGEVWRGVDEVLARQVAVKVLRTDLGAGDPFRQRFRTEARVAAMLSHPHIAQMYDYGETERSAYLVMELVPGEPLSTLITRHQTLGSDRTLGLMAQAARGLHAAHERGVVHRDVKPANVLVTPEGRVKITDFGIARPQDHQNLTATGQVMGTAHYLAPEVARGQTATALADIYALGVVTYECLAGWRPFDGPNQVAVATAHLRQPPPPLPDTIGPELRALVFQVLEKDPAKRPPTALALAETMEALRRRPRTSSRPVVADSPETAATSVIAPLVTGVTAAAAVGAAGTGTPHASPAALAGGAASAGVGDPSPAAALLPGSEPAGPDDDERRRRRPVVVLLGAAGLALVGLLGLWGILGAGDEAEAGLDVLPTPTSPAPTATSTDTGTGVEVSPSPTLTSAPAPTSTSPAPSVTVTVTPKPSVVTSVIKVVEPPATTRPVQRPTSRPTTPNPPRSTRFSPLPGVEYIYLGAEEYRGQDAATAQRILRDRGFPSVLTTRGSSSVARGAVVSMSPAGNVPRGTTITLVVSGGR